MSTILFSVFDKTGLEHVAQSFVGWGWNILASGGTATYLKSHGFEVRDVADLVGGGPILGHRVVTLSREVHAGLLARDNQEDRAELAELDIPFIDAAYITLYPLVAELEKSDATIESIMEKTDIGGPTMLRSAAKGRKLVAADKATMDLILDYLARVSGKPLPNEAFRRDLAFRVESAVAAYVLASAAALAQNSVLRAYHVSAYNRVCDMPLDIRCPI